jgi:hypothetical protein
VYDLGLSSAFEGPHKSFVARSLWNAADVQRLAASRSPYLGAAVSAWLDGLSNQALTMRDAHHDA